jgi:ElaB/YqjD/DUF883 family membrane-anchored ribosome-binding protein
MNTETKAGHAALGAAGNKNDSSKDKLMADLKILVADAEDLLKEAADASNEGFARLRARFEMKLAESREKIGRTRAALGEKTQHATDAAHAYVKENPWQSAGVLTAAGAFLGFCLGRRSNGSDVDVPRE